MSGDVTIVLENASLKLRADSVTTEHDRLTGRFKKLNVVPTDESWWSIPHIDLDRVQAVLFEEDA